jgi:hypothetical protein
MAAHEVDNINQVVTEIMQMMIAEMDERLAGKGVATGPLDKFKIKGMRMALVTAEKYSKQFNAEAKMDKFVAATNDVVPTLVKIFGEQTLVAKIPPQFRTHDVVNLSEKAGATEIAGLLRRSMAVQPT